jgi:two-component system LytT family sensor kinase
LYFYFDSMKSFLLKYKLHHIGFWLLFFAGWYYFRYQDYPAGKGIRITLLKVADLALMVYITNYLLIPRLLYRKKYLVFALLFVSMVFSFSIGKMYLEEILLGRPGYFDIWTGFKTRVYDNVIPHVLLVSTGGAFKLLADYAKTQKRLAELAKEKADAELQFLRSQINPHFLFNSLNSIYFSIDKQNADARQLVLQFSDLLRYQLYECGTDTIAIEKELLYLGDYIKLQQLRKDAQYEVKWQPGEGLQGFFITPLLLAPFVENAFKHISHHRDKKNFIHIGAERQNGAFRFTVNNSKDNYASTEGQGGIGLANIKRRLELLYPGKHTLAIDNTEDRFSVVLELEIS